MTRIRMIVSVMSTLALVGVCSFEVAGAQLEGMTGLRGEELSKTAVGAELARVASIDLGLRPNVRPIDYLIAAHALSHASAMRPGDAELARLAAVAAWSAGDQQMLMDATRSIIRADPNDTVAQLRVISANINGRQTVESRIEAYDRILGPAGKALDTTIRSRLALDAALLLRESGDNTGFERLLRESVDLDQTNKDAVSLATRTFSKADSGVEELIDWQIRLLYADPFDPHVHMTIARICAGQGALDAAERFVDNVVAIYEVSGLDAPALIREQRLALLWQQQGPEAVLENLNGPLEDMRAQSAAVIEARIEAGEPHDDIRNPEDIRYEIGIERIRLLAANAIGDVDAVNASLTDLARSTEETMKQLADATQRPGVDQVALANEIVRVFGDLQIMRGIIGRDTERMLEETRVLMEQVPAAERLLARVEPWVAYAEGKYQESLDRVNSGRPGPLMVLLAGLSNEGLGDIDAAASIYSRFSQTQPLDAYGTYARSRLALIGRESEAITTDGTFLEQRLARLPGWLDRMLSDPRAFMLLNVEVPEGTTDALTGSVIRVRLRNTSPIPLGLGSSRPVGSRFLIAPRASSSEIEFSGELSAKVVDLDRRFRLGPLEEIEVVIRADSSYSEWLRAVNSHTSQRDRYRVLQSFQPGPLGGLVAGPLGLVSESRIVQRTALSLSRASVDEIVAAIDDARDDTLRSALVASMCRLMQSDESGLHLSTEEKARVAAAWETRFTSASDLERALILLSLPHAGQVFEFESFDKSVLETLVGLSIEDAKSNETLLISALYTRVRSADSPLFELASASASHHVRELGRLLSDRLRAFEKAYATIGPGVNAMGPPLDVLRVESGR